MLWREIRSVLPLIAVCSLLLGVGGCWNPFNPDEEGKPPPGPVPTYDRTTWNNLMDYFAKAHEDRDIEKYAESLHPQYSFWFSEDDRDAPDWDWKDWIEKVEDREVTEGMFAAESVTNIQVTFTNLTTPGDTASFNVGYDPGDGEPFKYYWAEFGVDMHVVEDAGETEIDHWVDGKA